MRLIYLVLPLAFLAACRQAPKAPKVSFEENKNMLSPRERYGDLFIEAQMAAIFPDGKTFVDCRPKYPTDQILGAYKLAKEEGDFDIAAFVGEYFDLPKAYATNFQSDPSRPVDEHINLLWDILTRTPDESDNGTLIPLPYPYIVPGGRFGEIYYWDSYFTMFGLREAGMADMIESMVDNFAYLIDTIGFIPNGNRTYFNTRSQPPFFAAMVQLLGEARDDKSGTLKKYLPQLEREYAFWMDGQNRIQAKQPAIEHVVQLKDDVVLNRYWDAGDYPREEMHKVDVEFREESGRAPEEFYTDVRAACESGWDFSSRWFEDGQNITTIVTADIIPVDLNALLYNLELTLAQAYQEAGQLDKAAPLLQQASQRKMAIQKYCWDDELGFYRDYNFVKQDFTPVLSLAAAFPLYFGVADTAQAIRTAQVLQTDFLKPGGLLSTKNNTGQQWDAPNGWAPLQLIAIDGLKKYGENELAQEIATRWINLNKKVYKNTGKLVEKYNVEDMSLESGGGEYPVQDGFGWTNGVLLYLLNQ
ncbi:MAG: alpha,alpha-trehalase TreF [Bacteroidota bacterium]